MSIQKNKFSLMLSSLIYYIMFTTRQLFSFDGCCKFEPSCTVYAKQALHEHKLHKACWLIIRRVLSCW